MSGIGQFVAKVSKIKTRSKDKTDYYSYRINIPHQIVKELELKADDYLFVKSSSKAKWYHIFKWNKEPKAWNMLPEKLQQEIKSSGMEALPQPPILLVRSITTDPWLKYPKNIVNVSGTTLSQDQQQIVYVKNK
jgi:hypothetical protein